MTPAGYRPLMREFVLESKEDVAQCSGFIRSLVITKRKDSEGREIPNGWRVVIEPNTKARTVDQNKKYWATLNDIAEVAWLGGRQFPSTAWHHYFASKLIGMDEMPGGGFVPMSTTKLNTKEFSEYMERVEAYAAQELNVEFMR